MMAEGKHPANAAAAAKPAHKVDKSKHKCEVSDKPKKGVVLSLHPVLFESADTPPKKLNEFKRVSRKKFDDEHYLLADGVQEAVIDIQIVDVDCSTDRKLVGTSASGGEVVVKTSPTTVGILVRKSDDGKTIIKGPKDTDAEIHISVTDIKDVFKNTYFKMKVGAVGTSATITCTIENPDASYVYSSNVTIPAKEDWSNSLIIQTREIKKSTDKHVKVKGYDVMKLQWYLRTLGYFKTVENGTDASCDGIFGPALGRALNRFQRRAKGPYRNSRSNPSKPNVNGGYDADDKVIGKECFKGDVNETANNETIEEINKWMINDWYVPLGRLGLDTALLNTRKILKLRTDVIADFNLIREEIYSKGGILRDEDKKEKVTKKIEKIIRGKKKMVNDIDKNGNKIWLDVLINGKPHFILGEDGKKIYDGTSSFRGLEENVTKARSILSNHYLGIAVDLAQFLEDFLPVRRYDGSPEIEMVWYDLKTFPEYLKNHKHQKPKNYPDDFWTVWAFSSKNADPSKGIYHIDNAKATDETYQKKYFYYDFLANRPTKTGDDLPFPPGDYFNITEIFQKHNFRPISPHSDYLTHIDNGKLNDQAQEWWHFQYILGSDTHFQDEIELVDVNYTEAFLKQGHLKKINDKNHLLDHQPG